MSKESVHQLTGHLFRHEAGRIVSILTGIYGSQHLQLAEDVVQEAMIKAMKSWPFGGVPANPGAWLLRTAKNLAIDQLRRRRNFLEKEAAIIIELEANLPDGEAEEASVGDDLLRLMFVCCHPELPPEAQSALALKTLCGFSPAEIAKAFLISEAAVSKRLVRARQRIREERIPFEIPAEDRLPERLEGVLKILYLLFNEGHSASQGDAVVRADLCHEAIRLGLLLAAHPAGDDPQTHALVAMMAFTAARLPARTDHEGNLLRLEEQDRGLWDRELIGLGLWHLGKSSVGRELGEYHLQAGIAACHSLAVSDEATDWARILGFYDRLLERNFSPVVALNRAVAFSKVHGPDAAILLLEAPEIRGRLEAYHRFHAVLGELEFRRGGFPAAAGHFRRAISLAETGPERVLLARRLEECVG